MKRLLALTAALLLCVSAAHAVTMNEVVSGLRALCAGAATPTLAEIAAQLEEAVTPEERGVIELTDATLDDLIASADKPVVVDFWASWCGPCMMLSPAVEAMAEERDDIIFASVNVDDPETYGLSYRFQVTSIPRLLFFSGGELVGSQTGVGLPADEFLAYLIEIYFGL